MPNISPGQEGPMNHRPRRARSSGALTEMSRAFGFSTAQLAAIFAQDPAEIRAWRREGPPPAAQARITIMAAIGKFLETRVKPGVLPGIARTGAPAYGGLSLYEMFVEGREVEVEQAVRQAWDWNSE
jgi:hypothetical protein